MTINPIAVGDKATAALINAIIAQLNGQPAIIPGDDRIQFSQTAGGVALASGVFTTVTGYSATADVDTFGGSTFNPATGVWTCPAAGNYKINGQVSATGATAVRLIAAIFKNGAALYSAYESGAPTTIATAVLTPKEFTLAANDQITLQGNPNAAGVSTAVQNGNGSFLRIERMS